MNFRVAAFSMIELVLVLILVGILASFGIPKIYAYGQHACTKKLQAQFLNLKLLAATSHQKPFDPLALAQQVLDLQKSTCYWEASKHNLIAHNQDKRIEWRWRGNVLECNANKSARLKNHESYCDIF